MGKSYKTDSRYSREEKEKLIDLEMFDLVGRELKFVNLFDIVSRESPDDFCFTVLRLMAMPEFFYFTAKYLYGVSLMPYQVLILQELWNRQFPMLIACRGAAKSFLLGIHSLNRAVFLPGRKVVITGSGFRQAKAVFGYAEDVWNSSQRLQTLFSSHSRSGPKHDTDKWSLTLGDSVVYGIPLGDGQKIRGQRAHDVIADERASISTEIFNSVVRGFGVVNMNPFEQVRNKAKQRVLKKIGEWKDGDEDNDFYSMGNATILSGTAFYCFNDFYKDFREYKTYIESKGDLNYIYDRTGKTPGKDFNYRNYSIMRIPVDLMPNGYMSKETIEAIRMSVNSITYQTEFGAVFVSDTDGFYKRSMLEVCTTHKPIEVDGRLIQFVAMIRGDFDKKYVMGVDVAAIKDNFAIVIVEMNEGHRRIVYCWTTNVKEYKKRVELGLVREGGDFYSFCGRKIRNLMKWFNIVLIACDAQGGGEAIKGVLSNTHYIQEGELPIYEIVEHHPLWDGKKKDTDDKKGLHILQCVQFSNADWTSEANHGMRLDFEQCRLLFPRLDSSLLAIEFETMSEEMKAMNKDLTGERYDTLESCYQEITELKDELSTIEMRQTTAGQREKWDTPETKMTGSKKGRQRKDRYSALLMAETGARHLSQVKEQTGYIPHGGFVGQIKNTKSISENMGLYSGPEVLTSKLANQSCGYGVVVHNKRK
jgi:hypothetical protein